MANKPTTCKSFFLLVILFVIAGLNHQKRVLQQFLSRENVTAVADTVQRKKTSQQDENEHELFSSESIADRIKNTNSSDYKWVGNQWVPPSGVPVFTSSQIKKYFSKRNVLVIGDSTSRRMHVTMLGLMGAADLDNVKKIEVDDPIKLNMNKNGGDTSCTHLKRKVITMPGKKWSACADLPADGEDGEAPVAGDNSTRMKTVKFDQTIQYCYLELAWLWRDDDADPVKEVRGTRSSNLTALNKNVEIFSENYDLVIIANGIWEIAQPQQCLRNAPPNSTLISRLELALDRIHRNTPNDLQVMFRTNAFDVRHPQKNDDVLDSIQFAKQYFYEKKQNEASLSTNHDGAASRSTSNIGLVDWGGVIKQRSFGEDRIVGDHPAHYGLEGRTLYIQQLMHELVKADLMKKLSGKNEKVDLSEWHNSVS